MSNTEIHRDKNWELLHGDPMKTVITFAIPITLGNIFQQLYNIVDAAVVGKYLGDTALTGISVASATIDVLNAIIIGGSIGISVLIGQLCGTGDWDKTKKVHATALTGGVACTAVMTLLSLLLCGALIDMQELDASARSEALIYLRTISIGLTFSYIYNYYAAVLRAYGDSRTPFVVLVVSSVLHALLDFLFVGILGLGIGAVAVSTIFCQLFSGVWMILYTHRHYTHLALGIRDLRIHKGYGLEILSYAWASALQQAVNFLGRLMIQSQLNGLGGNVISGYNMSMRTEQFLYCFSQGISASMVACIAQNKGKQNYRRVRDFFYAAVKCEVIAGALLGSVCLLIPEKLIGIFSRNEEVIAAGVAYIGTIGLLYIVSFCGEIVQGFYRGLGRLRQIMLWSAFQIGIRVVAAYYLVPKMGVLGISYSAPIPWIILVLIEGTQALRTAKKCGRMDSLEQ